MYQYEATAGQPVPAANNSESSNKRSDEHTRRRASVADGKTRVDTHATMRL